MADISESSSSASKIDKPVLVRVKRKAFQSTVEGFWLEINKRPLKKQLLDFEKLSLSDSCVKVEELKTKKVFVQHVETLCRSEVTYDILQSFVPFSACGSEFKAKGKDRRHFKVDKKQDELLVKAKQEQELLSRNARFEQIWRSRKEKREMMRDEAIHEMCCFYDVVRVDVEETQNEKLVADVEGHRLMASYLPLLREFIPSAAEEIESDINDFISKQGSKEDYVYDLYAVNEDIHPNDEDALKHFPLLLLDDHEDFYDGLSDSEFSDDSNAENNPLNDYPDEEISEDDEEEEESVSNDEREEKSTSDDDELGEHEVSDILSDQHEWLHEEDALFDDEFFVNDDQDYSYSDGW